MSLPHAPFRLEANEVAFQYPNKDYGVSEISFHAQSGEFIHIVGDSGSGKSTLARCLAGIIPHLYRGKLHGEVRIEGLSTTEHPLWRLVEHVGMVFQNPTAQMMGTSVEEEIILGLENLGHSPSAISRQLESILARFELNNLRFRIPQTLSGGEQQKLALAAIVAREPSILVLDEPLSMLDVTSATDFVNYLSVLAASGTTIIILEHRAEYLSSVPDLRQIRLNGIPKLPQTVTTPLSFRPADVPYQLNMEGVSVHLGNKPVLNDLSFTASGGKMIAVVGRNGTGKTTLLRALAGLQPYQGHISINGETPDLGLVYQNADLQLFTASVRDEILFRVSAPDMVLYRQLLVALGLERYEYTPPLLLSEGEKKRVALATVLIRQPRHGLLLDEPSLGQDTQHKEMLLHIAHSLNQSGRLVLLTTHDLSLAAGADYLLLLSDKGIAAYGPTEEVFQNAQAWATCGLFVPDWIKRG